MILMSALTSHAIQVDLLKSESASAQIQMVRVAEQLSKLHSFEQTFWTSALRTQGVAKLQDFLMSRWAHVRLLAALHTEGW